MLQPRELERNKLQEKYNCYELRGEYTTVEIEFKTTISILPRSSSTAGHTNNSHNFGGPLPFQGNPRTESDWKKPEGEAKAVKQCNEIIVNKANREKNPTGSVKAPKGSGTKKTIPKTKKQ